MAISDWWSGLADAECMECGELHSVFTRSCPRCGAVNAARTGAIVIVASLGILLVAGAFAVFMVLHWQGAPGAETGAPPAEQPAATASEDFGWLTGAMQECDAQAEKEQSTLHFLVIPLAADKKDEDEWRAKSLNDIGHAILLASDAALEGLKLKTLRIAEEDYLFSIRDQTTATYNWKKSKGVAKFSIANANSIETFYIQFRTGDRPLDEQWGAAFDRKRGNCYWVNAIMAN
jgi:hypothetical protein